MICPHCHRTIEEQDRYLMSVDREASWPSWAPTAIVLLLCLAVIATMALFGQQHG